MKIDYCPVVGLTFRTHLPPLPQYLELKGIETTYLDKLSPHVGGKESWVYNDRVLKAYVKMYRTGERVKYELKLVVLTYDNDKESFFSEYPQEKPCPLSEGDTTKLVNVFLETREAIRSAEIVRLQRKVFEEAIGKEVGT